MPAPFLMGGRKNSIFALQIRRMGFSAIICKTPRCNFSYKDNGGRKKLHLLSKISYIYNNLQSISKESRH